MNELRPNSQRAKNAITLIWIIFGLEILSTVSGYFQYDLLQTVANGGEISMEAATMNDLRESNIALIYLVLYIISVVTFIKWFRRAYFNLHQRVDNLSHSEGWAAGSWFVPIVSLYRPYQIMKELYVKTRNLLTNEQSGYTGNLTTACLGWWWALWLISGLIGRFTLRYALKAETIDQYIESTVGGMINNLYQSEIDFRGFAYRDVER